MAGLKVITAPASEPVTCEEIKRQLQIDVTDTMYDDQIDALLPAARSWCEKYQNRAYISQKLRLALDCWPNGETIPLPRPPLQSVVTILHGEPGETWDSGGYIVDDYSYVGRVVRKTAWPNSDLPPANGIKVEYIAGYGDAPEAVPLTIRQAIILLCVHWFNNGVCDPPNAVYSLLNLERVIPV